MPAIVVEELGKRFGKLEAVRGISFDVRDGEIFGFLGPNGAGKTTTISILCTLLRPSAGRAWVAGCDVVTQKDAVRRAIGLVFQDPTLDEYLTAEQNLRFHAQAYGVPASVWRPRAAAPPTVLFLDEPTLGLDPQTRRRIWDHVLGLRRQKQLTIFLTTHYMEEAEHCDRIAIIDHGRIVELDTPARLKSGIGGDLVTLEVEDPSAAVREIVTRFGLQAELREGAVTVRVPDGSALLPELVRGLTQKVAAAGLRRPTLEDVFVAVTGRAIRAQEADPKDALRARRRRWGRRWTSRLGSATPASLKPGCSSYWRLLRWLSRRMVATPRAIAAVGPYGQATWMGQPVIVHAPSPAEGSAPMQQASPPRDAPDARPQGAPPAEKSPGKPRSKEPPPVDPGAEKPQG